MLNVRMDDELKQEATAVLNSLGLSASDAVRILFTRIVRQRAFPMELQAPVRAPTQAAPEDGAQALMAQLDELAKQSIMARAANLRPPTSSP
ncbi:MAG: hypothetical protein RL625_499 [Gemmatimonadota bacterium]